MSTVGIKVTGQREIEDLFKALPYKIAASVLRKGITEGARHVRDRAKKLAPRDTGALRKSIKVRGLAAAKAAGYQKKMGFAKGGSMPPIGKQVVAEEFYAHIIEFGRKGAPAANGGQGFLRPAGGQMQQKVRQLIEQSVRAALMKGY
jgi:HK97 gp10 family phage protein